MTKEEAIERACKIVAMAWRAIDPESKTASDCFCSHATMRDSMYQNEGMALAFVEKAVTDAIAALASGAVGEPAPWGCTCDVDAKDTITKWKTSCPAHGIKSAIPAGA